MRLPLDFLSPAHRRWLMSSSECSCLRFISLSKCDYYRHFNASDRLPVSLSFDCLSLLCGVLSVKAEPIVWIGWPFVKCNPSQPLIFGFARCKPMHSKRTQPSNCPQFPCIGKFIGVFARFWTVDHLRNQQKRKIYLSAKLFDIHTHTNWNKVAIAVIEQDFFGRRIKVWDVSPKLCPQVWLFSIFIILYI